MKHNRDKCDVKPLVWCACVLSPQFSHSHKCMEHVTATAMNIEHSPAMLDELNVFWSVGLLKAPHPDTV